jgi:pSer/pThr/pTyr-binding forkhead associated (FHA) protein
MEGVVVAGKRSSRKSGNSAILDARPRKRNGRTDGRGAVLTITNGCFEGLEISIKKQKTSLGRAVSCDICLDQGFVAEEHAIIRESNGRYEIEDLNSRHGTSINGEEVHKHVLKRGDKITIGMFELKFSC